jgi:polyisoprenoid-binding protein YceI
MKKLVLLLALAIVGFMSFTSKPAPTTFKVDASKSTFKWTGKKVVGSHTGNIKFTEGTVSLEKGALVGGAFTIDMNSMDCPDQGGDKLVGHLKSDDFFGTQKFPTANLRIKSTSPKGNNMYDVKADLTIKGITNEIMFPATVLVTGGELTATASFAVDRTKYGIKYGSGSFFDNLGDKAISNEFQVEINLAANGDAPAATAPAPATSTSTKKKSSSKAKAKKATGTGK